MGSISRIITTEKANTSVWLYPSTFVGYTRLMLLGSALVWHFWWTAAAEPWLRLGFVVLVGLSRLLDLLDGYLARKFNQISFFGTLVDLWIDLLTHTVVWLVSGFYGGLGLAALEWTTGLYVAAFALRSDTGWKTMLVKTGPGLIRLYFARNQRNFLSAYGNIGHFITPMAFYAGYAGTWLYYLFVPGLILYEVVTLFMLYVMLKVLAEQKQGQDLD